MEQVLLALAALSVLFSLWAAIFATRASGAARRAQREAADRWEAAIRPQPKISFPVPPAMSRPLEVEVENLGGAVMASVVVVQSGDNIYSGDPALPEKAAPRRILLESAMKAWHPAPQPTCLLLAAKDQGGGWWDCLAGGRVKGDARRWLDQRLREMRLDGAVTVSDPPPHKR